MPNSERHSWLAVAGAWRVARRLRADWGALPRRARERWFRVLAAGLVLNCALMAALVWAARRWHEAGGTEREARLLERLAEGVPLSFGYAIVLQELGGPVTLVLLLLFGVAGALWARRPLRAMSILAAFFLLGPVILLGWELWSRARPDIVQGGIANPGGLHAFPSGHVASTAAVYGVLLLLWARNARHPGERVLAVLLWLFAVALVAVARLRLGVHWPSDIVAGVLIGAFWVGVVLWAHAAAEARAHSPRADAGEQP